MNFLNLLSEIEQVDPEVYDRLDSRRRVFKHLSGVGQKLSAAALPLFVGAVFNKAYGQTSGGQTVLDVLNFALKLEYLEMYFYRQNAGLQGRVSAINYLALFTFADDETKHVAFLRSTIAALGGTPIADPTAAQFDYSGARISSTNTAGPFGDWRTNPATYLALAQTFEDLGVRAYKGAAPQLMANKTVLTAALGIHGVEARHASHIRSMRRGGINSSNPSPSVPAAPYSALPKSWISGTDNGGAGGGTTLSAYTTPVYGAGVGTSFPADDNVVQGGVTLSGSSLPNASGFPAAAFSEAFDEGLDVATVSTIARLFTVATSTLF
ncbi:MAG: ferritin-like domain-containing protein [Cytophagaceae bacterium]|nr:MAG: ferritin-like domain-containing protein [Cytophagaceae bacterium]